MADLSIFDFGTAAPLSLAQAEARQSRIDAEEVRERLRGDVRGFVQFLFSGRANVRGRTAFIGDVNGTPGASLSIAISGERAGLWHDFATGEGGDLIDLFLAYRGYDRSDFRLALKEIARDFLHWNVEIDSPPRISLREHIERKKVELGTEPRADHVLLGAPVAKFYYRDLAGNVLASVVRYEPDGTRESKTFRPYYFKLIDGERRWVCGAPEVRPLYRLADIVTHERVVLCEGEGKADALASLGIAATSAMQGADAPIGKTEWHWLAGKEVVVWPDNDAPGRAYGDRVAAYLALLGCRVRMVQIPAGVRPKWDAADAVAEGVDARALVDGAVGFTRPESSIGDIRVVDFATLVSEDIVEEPNYLDPDLLAPGGFLLIAGPPKAQKSFLVQEICINLATGGSCLGGLISAPEPKRVFYLQAEMSRKLLRARAKVAGKSMSQESLDMCRSNLIISERFEMLLDQAGVIKAAEVIMSTFGGHPPDVIAVDPFINVFDGKSENDNAEVAKFLRMNLGVLRNMVNPNAGIIMAHHAAKRSVEEMRKDPFLIIRGASAMRGHYDTGIVIFEMSRETHEREIHFDLRAAESPDAIKVKLLNGSFHYVGKADGSDAIELPGQDLSTRIAEAITASWNAKRPLSMAVQTRKDGRYAPAVLARRLNADASDVAAIIENWLSDGIVIVDVLGTHDKVKGLRMAAEITGNVA